MKQIHSCVYFCLYLFVSEQNRSVWLAQMFFSNFQRRWQFPLIILFIYLYRILHFLLCLSRSDKHFIDDCERLIWAVMLSMKYQFISSSLNLSQRGCTGQPSLMPLTQGWFVLLYWWDRSSWGMRFTCSQADACLHTALRPSSFC